MCRAVSENSRKVISEFADGGICGQTVGDAGRLGFVQRRAQMGRQRRDRDIRGGARRVRVQQQRSRQRGKAHHGGAAVRDCPHGADRIGVGGLQQIGDGPYREVAAPRRSARRFQPEPGEAARPAAGDPSPDAAHRPRSDNGRSRRARPEFRRSRTYRSGSARFRCVRRIRAPQPPPHRTTPRIDRAGRLTDRSPLTRYSRAGEM